LGPEGRRFESYHPDYRKPLVSLVSPRVFSFLFTALGRPLSLDLFVNR